MNTKQLEYLKDHEPAIHAQVVKVIEQRDDLMGALGDLTKVIPPPTGTARIEADAIIGAAVSMCFRIRREIEAESEEEAANDATEKPSEEPHIIESRWTVEETSEPLFTLAEVLCAVESGRRLRIKFMECVHCDWTAEYVKRDDDAEELIKEHIKSCPGHPMREMERKIKELEDQLGDA